MANPFEIYDLMLDVVASDDAAIEELLIGLTWTYCRSSAVGLCMTADTRSRTFEWPGTLKGQSVKKLSSWILEWDPMKSSIAQAAINSVINQGIIRDSKIISASSRISSNLAVFEYFLPAIQNKKCVVIGRYPGLELLQQQYDLQVIELNPGINDFPAIACEYVLPEAEWIFISGTSIANKTFPRLMELSKNANVVLMGPSVPWLSELAEFGVDFLAGIVVQDNQQLQQTVAEGGGTNIFSRSVQYAICDLGQNKMQKTRDKIQKIVNLRESLKDEMQAWYHHVGRGTFPKTYELLALDEKLSLLDSQYKKMWDMRQSFE